MGIGAKVFLSVVILLGFLFMAVLLVGLTVYVCEWCKQHISPWWEVNEDKRFVKVANWLGKALNTCFTVLIVAVVIGFALAIVYVSLPF